MSPDAATDICRVTVVGPRKRVDLALPGDVPFAQLFPGIARFAGLDEAALDRAPEGWSLQRLGEPPFEPPATPAEAGVADGELLYLRPWPSVLPAAASDDIADEIAAVHDGPGRWDTARDGRRVALGAGAAALASGLVVLFRSGPPWPMTAMAAGLLAVLLLAAGAALSRAAGDAVAGAVLGYAALPYAFAAGSSRRCGTMPLTHLSALAMLAGFALVLTAALIAATAIAHGTAVFLGGCGRRRVRYRRRRAGLPMARAGSRRCRRAGGHPGPGADAAHPGCFVPAGPAPAAGRPGQPG